MKKPSKPDPGTPSPMALFRYRVLSQAIAGELRGQSRPAAIRAVVATVHTGPDERPRRVSERSVYRWLASYRQGGMGALEPVPRSVGPKALSAELLAFFAQEKRSDPLGSVPELIRRARAHGLVDADEAICRTTVWRGLKRLAVDTRRRKAPKTRDCRRFAYPHRMDMILCDGKRFRAGRGRHRRVALFFLDDASRFGLHVVVGTAETAVLFLRGLYECIRLHGLMTAVYVDNGSGFIAREAIAVLSRLEVIFIHGTAGYPEGHGKIERFNRTALNDVLRALDGNASVDPDCAALELRLRHYLREQYNPRAHESLAPHSPASRFHADAQPLRSLPHARLRQAFVLPLERRVSNDHVVSVDSVPYEVPRGLAGARVTRYRALLDDELTLLHEGRLRRLAPVDPPFNARQRRAKPAPEAPSPMAPKTCAQLRFEQDLGPIVDADGGFSAPTPEDE